MVAGIWNRMILVGLALACTVGALAAQREPQPGEAFPHELAAPDQTGKVQSLRTLMGEKGLVVLFVRSADWCPFCKGQLVDTNRHVAGFRALGLNVATVSVDEVPLVAAFARDQQIGYTMLADPKGDINLSLGIRDEQYPVGTKAFGVPKPTLYVIDRLGTVRLRYQEPTYRTRPDLDKVIADIRALGL